MLKQENTVYYVDAQGYIESVIARWASMNEMKMSGDVQELPERGKVYRLYTEYNPDLSLKMGTFCHRGTKLLNGKRVIGKVKFDSVMAGRTNVAHVVIYPVIPDR